MFVRNKSIHFNTANEKFSVKQDTTNSTFGSKQDTVKTNDSLVKVESFPLKSVRELNLSEIDSILRRSEERERQIELEKQQQQVQRAYYRRPKDTTEILYKEFGIAGFPLTQKLDQDPFKQNFLYNYISYKPEEKVSNSQVFIEENSKVTSTYSEKKTHEIGGRPEYIKGKFQLDWITVILAVSLLILGWVRLFNKKYLISILKSIISYQESNSLLREKNSLMERASFLMNTLFISNTALFTVHLRRFFNFSFDGLENYMIYLVLFSSLLGLYIFRAITSGFIGYVFLKQKVFAEYFHNVNIYTKTTGMLLFPIVIGLQFLTYNSIEIFIYTGITMISVLYFFMLIRSFQIFIRKNVSIFYMILYLCAFEISPFLLIYKLMLTLV